MIITKLQLENFQLFKNVEINLQQLNIITGINFDDIESSSNGSGKSTILNAIFFGLFGEVPGLNLKDLITIGTKETKVELHIKKGNDNYIITRKVPSSLSIFCNGEELEGNTLTIKQKLINDLFCDSDFFKRFRTIDTNKGINILELGTVSLRKILMTFIDTLFSGIRQNLLSKKLERERFNVDKRIYKFYLSEKRLKQLEEGLKILKENIIVADKEKLEESKIINNIKADIQSKEKMVYYKNNEIKKAKEGICPILREKCERISQSLNEKDNKTNLLLSKEIKKMDNEIIKIMEELIVEENCMSHCISVCNFLYNKERKTKEYIMKLKEAFKFADYKYTAKDVMLYTEAIKILDNFAGFYINNWLSQLALIINDLLKGINLEVTFSPNKEFIKIKNGTNELKFEQLSTGQKIFLNAIFKIAILLQKGVTDGAIICDEGLSSLDKINLNKFLDICKGLNFQILLIYHNIDMEDKDINFIKIERKDGISEVK